MRYTLGKHEVGTIMRNAIAYLVRFPSVLQGGKLLRGKTLEALTKRSARVTTLFEYTIENDIGFNDGKFPVVRIFRLNVREHVLEAVAACCATVSFIVEAFSVTKLLGLQADIEVLAS